MEALALGEALNGSTQFGTQTVLYDCSNNDYSRLYGGNCHLSKKRPIDAVVDHLQDHSNSSKPAKVWFEVRPMIWPL